MAQEFNAHSNFCEQQEGAAEVLRYPDLINYLIKQDKTREVLDRERRINEINFVK